MASLAKRIQELVRSPEQSGVVDNQRVVPTGIQRTLVSSAPHHEATAMGIERAPGGSSLIHVLDRVLDKGIVIDAWVRVSVVGIELVTVEARVVVASIATYFSHAEVLAELSTTSPARRALPALTKFAD